MLYSICQQVWKAHQWLQEWKRSVFSFQPIPDKGNAKESSNYQTIAVISHVSKVMLTVHGFSSTWTENLPLHKLDSERQQQRNQRSHCQHSLYHRESNRISVKPYFCFISYAKAFHCVDHNKPWKILKETGISDHLTCLLRNLNAGQEATVRIWHGRTDWFKIGKEVWQGYILSPCLFNLYAEYIMQNTRLNESITS